MVYCSAKFSFFKKKFSCAKPSKLHKFNRKKISVNFEPRTRTRKFLVSGSGWVHLHIGTAIAFPQPWTVFQFASAQGHCMQEKEHKENKNAGVSPLTPSQPRLHMETLHSLLTTALNQTAQQPRFIPPLEVASFSRQCLGIMEPSFAMDSSGMHLLLRISCFSKQPWVEPKQAPVIAQEDMLNGMGHDTHSWCGWTHRMAPNCDVRNFVNYPRK